MGSCAVGTCTDPACPICVDLPARFPPIVKCPGETYKGDPCRLVAGHSGWCLPGRSADREPNVARDGAPATKGGKHLAFVKRTRLGPGR